MNNESTRTKQFGGWRSLACGRRLLSIILPALTLATVHTTARAQSEALNFSGDFRVRHEVTSRQEPSDDDPNVLDETRNREVVRFRFNINKKINSLFSFGARLATGSPDDPNTADITLGDFDNDLLISLDRAYVELKYKNLYVAGGKFANMFLTTELVWDGDVNLQGFGAAYTVAGLNKITPKISGTYFIIDEQTLRDDSYMQGGQFEVGLSASPDLTLRASCAYYDYTINSLVNAGSGDILSNRLNASRTGYLSDFDLLDIAGTLDYRKLSKNYPLRIAANYVKNLGADDLNTGFGADAYLGQIAKKGGLRFQYGYAQTETDAVLAAFSHDNTTLSTNYDQHTTALDYVVADNTVLTATWYYYRLHALPEGSTASQDYFSRLRLNCLVRF